MPPKPTATQHAQLSLGQLGGIVLHPDMLDEQRGAWCSPEEYTKAAGPFAIDPFSNARSTVRSLLACWLERGDDAFGLERRDTPGMVWLNKGTPVRSSWDAEVRELLDGRHVLVDESYTVWIQPPYDIVIEALAHFGHTRFCALLRLDTSTVWFQLLYAGITDADLASPATLSKLTKALKHTHAIAPCPPLCEVVMVPKSDRLEFVPPPGVKASSNPFPHGLYYRRAADVPPAISALCYPWPTSRYPWAADPLGLLVAQRPPCAPSCTGSLVHDEYTACPVHDVTRVL